MKITVSAKHCTFILLAGLCLSFTISIGTAAADQRSGPAAWVEEYWDVKPEKFDEFIASYKKNVYALTRQVPGYRGYTFMTLIPDENGEPKPPQRTRKPANTSLWRSSAGPNSHRARHRHRQTDAADTQRGYRA